jgi:hypothetical protein
MFLKLALSIGLLTAVGMGTSFAQAPTPDVRSPTLGDPGAKPPVAVQHRPRFHRLPKPAATTGIPAPARAAAGR